MEELHNIKSWSEDDRPRERLIHKGAEILSLSELLAILIGSGSKEVNAVELSKRILASAGNDLTKLSRYSLKELCLFKGIGMAKAVTIKAALELGRRRLDQKANNDIDRITSSHEAYLLIRSNLMDLSTEEFWIIGLNRAQKVIQSKRISSGGTSGTVVDAKIVFMVALELKASSIILCHNHPSGTLQPSKADLHLTKKIVDAGKTLDINVLDHLIITATSYYSFADEGKI